MAFEPIQVINSVSVAAAAAVVAALAAIPIAYFAATSDSPLATLFERATYVGFAVPGIVLALALVYFGSGYLPWIYQTPAVGVRVRRPFPPAGRRLDADRDPRGRSQARRGRPDAR